MCLAILRTPREEQKILAVRALNASNKVSVLSNRCAIERRKKNTSIFFFSSGSLFYCCSWSSHGRKVHRCLTAALAALGLKCRVWWCFETLLQLHIWESRHFEYGTPGTDSYTWSSPLFAHPVVKKQGFPLLSPDERLDVKGTVLLTFPGLKKAQEFFFPHLRRPGRVYGILRWVSSRCAHQYL